MPKYLFVGDIVRPGRVVIEAETKRQAVRRAERQEFDRVWDVDGHDSLALFNWNDDEDTIEDIDE